MKMIDYWMVTFGNTPDECFERVCNSKPEKISDVYELKLEDNETLHLMSKDLSYIRWMPIYDDNNTPSDNQKDV